MTLNKRLLAKVDAQLRSELDHTEGVQLVKVPVSDAVWSSWRRYCDLVGIPMGRALAILLHRELASVVDEDLEGLGGRIEAREAEAESRARALAKEEKDLERRQQDLAIRESELGERQRDLEEREKNVAVVEHEVAQALICLTETQTPTKPVPKLGRNEPCWCGSERKYKNCHLRKDS
jgi:SEC-C motif